MSILHSILKTKSGALIQIDKELSFGGQGKVYLAINKKSHEPVVVKIFNNKGNKAALIHRIQFLISMQKEYPCKRIIFPNDLIQNNIMIGHCTPFVEGISLEEYLMKSGSSFSDRIEIALSIAWQFNHLHKLGIAHGDIRAQNFIIHDKNVYCIDLDNFTHQSTPQPNMVGETLYLSPEQREAFNNNIYYSPTIETDLYQLGILFHEILLLLHPAYGFDNTQEEFEQAMNGVWRLDPTTSNGAKNFSISILNYNLCNLFRKALLKCPTMRTISYEWIQALNDARDRLYLCPKCSFPVIIDVSRKSCPNNHLFKQLGILNIRTNKEIAFDRNSFFIGREHLNNDLKISSNHLLISRIGPELWIEHLGTNKTQIKQKQTWFDLPKNKKIKLFKNDIIQIMNHKLRVI